MLKILFNIAESQCLEPPMIRVLNHELNVILTVCAPKMLLELKLTRSVINTAAVFVEGALSPLPPPPMSVFRSKSRKTIEQ